MPVILDNTKNLYQPLTYTKEQDFEAVIVSLADQIFGRIPSMWT